MKLDIVTAERIVISEDVDTLIAPGIEGQLGILPHHVPLMTILNSGKLLVRKGKEDRDFAISGGFLVVQPDKVIVLVNSKDTAEEI
jgi:F-type H+-transporting ATPase subunit epsilon